MNLSNLPYLPRTDLENEVREFLQTHLSPRANSTKALLLHGEKGVGKRTLLAHCLGNTPELQRYKVCSVDLHAPASLDLEERNQKLKEKGFDSVVEVLKEFSPYALKLPLAVLHIFTKDEILKASPRESIRTLADIENLLFQLIRQQPFLLTIENFDNEHLRDLAVFVDRSYEREDAFVLVLITQETSEDAKKTLKDLQRFCRYDDHVRSMSVAPFTPQEYVTHFAACGLSSAWAETLHRFSEGYPGPLKAMWKNLQEEGFLKKEGAQWRARDEPQHILSRDFLRTWLRKLTQRHQHQTTLKFRTPLDDALLLAAAMGETFLPQAVAETALSRKREYSPEEIAAWEDLWYDVIEEQGENSPALAEPVREQGRNKTLMVAPDRGFFVYVFHDPQWQAFLQYTAKRLCDPSQLDQPFYECLVHLDEWLQVRCQTNWEQALPYRIAVNRALWQNDAARALEKNQRLQKLRVELPQQISAERKRVAQGATAGGLYQLLRWYSEVLQERGEYPQALEAMQEAHLLVELVKIQFTDLELAEHLNELGMCYCDCGKSAEAEPVYRRSLAIREQKLGAEHPAVALSLNNLAGALHLQHKYAEAELLLHRSLAIREEKRGLEHLDVAQSLENLAALFYAQDRFSEAEPLFRRGLAIREKQLGLKHPAVARSLKNLAGLLYAQGKYDEAEPLYRRSLVIHEQQLRPEHPHVAMSLNSLALLLYAQGKYDEAEPLYRRSLALREQQLGPEHLEVAASLNNIAALLDSQGKYDEAEPLYRRSLAINEKAYGPDHTEVARNLNNLAVLLKTQGRYGEAEPLYRGSLAIWEKQLGPEHPDVALSLNNLAALLDTQGKYDEAEPLYRRSLAIKEQQLGPDHPDVALSLNNLAGLLKAQGKYAEAEPLYRCSLAIWEEKLGPDHPDIAASLNNLAVLLRVQGKYAEAEPLSRRSLEIREEKLGPEHPDVAQSLNNLAALLEAQGKFAEAEPLYRRAVEICEKSLGTEHPTTQTVRKNYALLLSEMKVSGS